MRFVVLLLLASCGDVDRTLEDGGRLHLRYWVYEDGTRQWDPTTYFDTKLEIECRPRTWADGHTYCTPEAGPVAYRDAGCGDPVGRVDTDVPHAFVREFTMSSERRPSRMYRPTDPRAGIDQFWLFDGVACTGPFPSGAATYVDVEEVEAVRMYASAPMGDGRVRATTLTTEDGLVAPGSLIDTLADRTCLPSPNADGTVACVPTTAAETLVFRDAACEQSMAILPDTELDRLVVRAGCDYFHRGHEVLNFPAYVLTDAGCVEIEFDPHHLAYEIGAPFPIAPLPAARVGASRLQPIELKLGDVALPTKLAYDSMFDVTCEAAPGFGTRCMPAMNDGDVSYRSRTPTCDVLEPFVIVERTTCEPARFAIKQLTHKPVIRHVSDPYRGALYALVEGACIPTDPGGDVYATSTIVPIESFAAAVRE